MRGTDYAELAAFVTVAQERSFRRAAARLGLSPSALSHTIRELEERLGARLLNRTTRSVAPTDAGARLLDQLAPAFAGITEAVAAVSTFKNRPSGTIRLNLPRLAAHIVLAPLFGRFAQTYPDVHLEVSVDDALTDIVAGGFDAGIRPGERVQRDMVAVRVTPDIRIAIVGSPNYLMARTPPRSPHDLQDHACINYRWAGSGALYRWKLSRDGKEFDLSVGGPLTLDDTDLIVAAAVNGAGLAYILESRIAGHLAAGRLLRVLEDWCPLLPGFFLYYPGRRHLAPALRALIDFVQVK